METIETVENDKARFPRVPTVFHSPYDEFFDFAKTQRQERPDLIILLRFIPPPPIYLVMVARLKIWRIVLLSRAKS